MRFSPLFTARLTLILFSCSVVVDDVGAFYIAPPMACPCSCGGSVSVGGSRRKQKQIMIGTRQNSHHHHHHKKNHAFQRIVGTSSLLFDIQQADDDGNESFQIEELPLLNQIFQKAVVLQRSGDRSGSLELYNRFLKVAESHDVDPMLYSEVHANMGAIYAMMQGKGSETTTTTIDVKTQLRARAKESFQIAVKYRPSLGSAWVNLALLVLAEGRELGKNNNSSAEQSQVMHSLKEARQCCERALGMDNEDERSRSLANKLIGDIDSMIRQMMKS